ncbi:M56 family metallopeptidase [Mucilaginibacter psychrotolerans]|uniref:M56 family metallopeptidase n=1 Tax=Mucilaginibacter psychrotolerans TaxID=1524096 RepID=A0A4Y8SHD7_9SPHI|nr:M56 family metallopeptidase [Mucilaginibacter psychrotolerans]TFF38035.1 M56 family metallopeptidase [Mucilaginibacter psychrotolerans]
MQSLFYNISQVLGIAILHSLWQGLLIWFMLRVVFSASPALSAIKKHNMAAVAMLGIAAWFMVTLFNEAGNFNWHPVVPAVAAFAPQAGMINQLSPFTAPADRYYYVIEGYLPYVTILYLAGLAINLFKLSYCRVKLLRIKKALLPPGDMQWLADEFAERLQIRRYVRVNFSSLVDVPCMIGYLKPIILLPISLSTNLSVAETEAILLHELAHIKRNDYLVNLLQQVINSLLFFNPFAQMISRLISAERENCCDDLVVQTTNNPLVYARALLKLEESRHANLQLALAASTNKHYLLTRIERIMKTQQKIGNIRHLVLAILLLAGSLSSIAWLNPEIKNGKITVKAVTPREIINTLFADTTRKKAVKGKPAKQKATKIYKDKVLLDHENFTFNDGMNDPELRRLGAELDKQSQALSKYYDSPDFKALTQELEKRGHEIDAYYNNDQMKALTANQQKLGADFDRKYGHNKDIEQYGKQMEALGKNIDSYFSSPGFKDMNARLKKKFNITSDYNDDHDPNYKKYQEELQANLPAQINKDTEEMKVLGGKMRGFFQSADFMASRDSMRQMGDSMRRAFDNPKMKLQQEQMRKLSDQMRAYSNNPDFLRMKKQMQDAAAKMRTYTQSPAFKKKMEEFRKQMKAFNWNDNNNNNDNNYHIDRDSVSNPNQPQGPGKP